ncbi:MAG: ATP-binding cassette domain-containing protein [Caldilineaceae bacterium]
MIQVRDLEKTFQVGQHRDGLLGSFRNLVSREYKAIRAVDHISFEIQTGELVGYLGPNGAGKSTTIKILSGLLTPTSGDVRVNGFVPWQERERYVRSIGAVFGQRTTLWWDLPVIDSLQLLQHIYRIPAQRFQQNLSEFRELLDLDPFLHTPVRALSLGQRMRADICAAMLHDPDILFLDEPTIGLDVVAKDRIRQFIQHTNQERGATIVLTTHDLSDVEKLCQRVLIIDHGKLLFDGALDSLQQRFGGKRELIVDLADEYDNVEVDGVVVGERTGRRVTYQFDRTAITASELIGRLSQRFRISDLSVREPDIEATIRRIYEERLLDA